jgi:hypothetical protein
MQCNYSLSRLPASVVVHLVLLRLALQQQQWLCTLACAPF